MIQQLEITLTPKSRGFHLVTSEIIRQLPKLPKTGIINIFCKHTSCGLSINENADPDVRVDMETIFNRLVPENSPALFSFKKESLHGMAGGHLKATTVLYTAEIELRPTIGGAIGRKFDPETGTGFWEFKD